MSLIYALLVCAIAYGSLFPFDFSFGSLDTETMDKFLGSWWALSSRGDLLGNLILFVPFGFLGTITPKSAKPTFWRAVIVLLLAGLFAAVLQFLQLFLPSRVAALNDVFWNLAGTGIGCAGGWLLSDQVARWAERRQSLHLIPLVLLGCWAVVRLAPFVPSIDLQAIKDSLKPLVLVPEISVAGVSTNAAGWLVVAYMIRRLKELRLPGLVLALIMILTFAVEILVVDNAVTGSNVVGAVAAWLLALVILRSGRESALVVAVILSAAIVVRGLEPFVLRPTPAPFSWIPFADFLQGAMYHNTLVLIEKTFLYGSLVYLLRSTGLSWLAGTVFVVSFLGLLEVAQIFASQHSPGVTDPVFAIVLGLALFALEAARGPVGSTSSPVPGPEAPKNPGQIP